MEKIICGEIDGAKGKTLLHVVWSVDRSNLLLVFDGDFPVQLGVDRGWDSGDEEITEDPSLDTRCYREELLLSAGVVTQEWVDAKNRKDAEYEAKCKEFREQKERETYEALKAKFEKQDRSAE